MQGPAGALAAVKLAVEWLMLTHTAYGKSGIRLVRLARRGDRHDLADLTLAIRFEGDYDASYTDGDNTGVLPTDTMKNTVNALAARERVDEPEAFALILAHHFLDRNARLHRVIIDVVQQSWGRLTTGGREEGQAFVRQGPEVRTAEVTVDRANASVKAGLSDLLILKSSRSAFEGFVRDELTTLPETRDRILATSLTATWQYKNAEVPFGPGWRIVRATLVECFSAHQSNSVQHTLYAMGQAVLDSVDDVLSIHLVMSNKHHLPIDVSRFGLENRNEVFVATDEPFERIEATLTR
jgi:urate oxidase